MDPMDFILLDVCLTTFSHQIPTPPTSLPAENQLKNGLTDPKAALSYRADWSAVDGVSGLTNRMDKTELYDSTQQTKKVNGELSDKDKTALAESPGRGKTGSRPPTSMPGLQYSSGSGFQAQRRIYLLQAGEEPPEVLQWNPGEMNGKKMSPGLATGAGLQQVQCPLYVEIVNEILDLKMPRAIEAKRLELLREDWIRQFHNMYLACFASDEGKVENFLLSMNVDRRDLKILRFFTRCARSAALQSQKYRSENPLVAMTAAAEAAEAAMAAAAAAAAEARVENQMHGPVLAQGPVQAGTPTVAAVTTAATVVTVSGTSATGYQKKSNGG
ncbi:hypothetical protein BGW38_008305 [Lunasporangiospora selenospora]|uniref:Uncharacterized protein n=1 Tax=Lunasporangiospora selenospora TaxID=979761 RepID=A0A9P6FJN2_9FUNG|nr:hypothetical protein BGW38_008305 [Lunasporangiospora selenospora]